LGKHFLYKCGIFVTTTISNQTCENFLALCGTDYYTDCMFTRNIKGFMVQTGDPTNTGKGGESIWGGKFAVGAKFPKFPHVPIFHTG
jgi:cyclophilin family peptidyl-prolyl cis-trans isomerase